MEDKTACVEHLQFQIDQFNIYITEELFKTYNYAKFKRLSQRNNECYGTPQPPS